jgi:hypothetical protein
MLIGSRLGRGDVKEARQGSMSGVFEEMAIGMCRGQLVLFEKMIWM